MPVPAYGEEDDEQAEPAAKKLRVFTVGRAEERAAAADPPGGTSARPAASCSALQGKRAVGGLGDGVEGSCSSHCTLGVSGAPSTSSLCKPAHGRGATGGEEEQEEEQGESSHAKALSEAVARAEALLASVRALEDEKTRLHTAATAGTAPNGSLGNQPYHSRREVAASKSDRRRRATSRYICCEAFSPPRTSQRAREVGLRG